jgi:hypothetical protein
MTRTAHASLASKWALALPILALTMSAGARPAHADVTGIVTQPLFGTFLSIDSIEQGSRVENRPMYIHFTLSNFTAVEQNGYVGAYTVDGEGSYADSGDYYRILRLAPWTSATGVVTMNAPASGLANLVDAYFFEGFQGEFGRTPTLAEDQTQIDTAARYVFSLGSITNVNPRARYNDTNEAAIYTPSIPGVPASCSDPSGNPAVCAAVSIGDMGAGATRTLNLALPPVDLLPSDPSFGFNYTVVNAGNHGLGATTDQVLNGISSVAAGVLDIVYPQAAAGWAALDMLTHLINDAITASCDGLVISQSVGISPTQLLIDTGTRDGSGAFIDQVARFMGHPGLPSPAVCGMTSNYRSMWLENRRRYNDDTLEVTPHSARLRAGRQLQLATNLGIGVYWQVEGGPVNGTITQAGRYTASATLPLNDYVTITARSGDGRQVAHAFVALDPTPIICRFCGRIPPL